MHYVYMHVHVYMYIHKYIYSHTYTCVYTDVSIALAVSKNLGGVVGSPHSKDHLILGSTLEPSISGNRDGAMSTGYNYANKLLIGGI